MRVEPIVEVTGDSETLMSFGVVNMWDGTLRIRSVWAIGTPVAYAPQVTREEIIEADELRARSRLHELLAALCWTVG
jgi:hypothetical protein